MARPRQYRPADGVVATAADDLGRPLPENAELVALYLRVHEHELLAATRLQYAESLGEFIAAIGPMRLADVRVDDVAAYFSERTRDPSDPCDARRWAPRTATKHRSALHGFFAFLLKQKHVADNPVEDFRIRRVDVAEPANVANDVIATILGHIEQRIAMVDERTAALYILDATLLNLMYRWGLRVSEATTLRMADIHLENKELIARIRQKRSKVRTFPFVGPLLGAYHRWFQVRARVIARVGPSDYLFIHPWTGRPITRQRTNRRLRQHAIDAGVDPVLIERITPHKLRHRFARNLLDAGEPLTSVQGVLGHASPATTSIYLRDDEETRLDVLRRAARRDLAQHNRHRTDA